MDTANLYQQFIKQNKGVFLAYDDLLLSGEVSLLTTISVNRIYQDDPDKFHKILYKACSLPENQYIRYFSWADFEFDDEMYFVCLKFFDKTADSDYKELAEIEDLVNPEKRRICIMLGLLSED